MAVQFGPPSRLGMHGVAKDTHHGHVAVSRQLLAHLNDVVSINDTERHGAQADKTKTNASGLLFPKQLCLDKNTYTPKSTQYSKGKKNSCSTYTKIKKYKNQFSPNHLRPTI